MASPAYRESLNGDAAVRSEAETVFSRIDINGSGTVTKTELKKELQKDSGLRQQLVRGAGWKAFFKQLNVDGESQLV